MPTKSFEHAPKTRVLVADPSYGDRLLLELAASDDDDVELVGACTTALSAARVADETHPSAIVVDPVTPAPNGTEVVSLLHAVCPDARIVVWSNDQRPDAHDAAIEQGAAVVVPKDTDAENVISAAKIAAPPHNT